MRASLARRRGLVRSARALVAAASLALVASLALPATATAQAEADSVLVSNLSNRGDGFQSAAQPLAQAFETGDHSAGYTLDAVELTIVKSSSSMRGLEVGLYTQSSSGDPGALLVTFPVRDIPRGGTFRFEAPAGTRLNSSTTYFIHLTQSGGSGGNLSVGVTHDTGQTGLDNWSIADRRIRYFSDSWSSLVN